MGLSRSTGRASDRTRQQVLDAAEQLFAERGFAGTSMRELAKASGVSQALIHHHFGRKRDLYNAVKERLVQRFLQMLGSEPAQDQPHPGASELWQWVTRLFEFFRQHPRLVRLLSWERLEGSTRLWPAEQKLLEALQALGNELERRGALRAGMDPLMLVAILEGLVVSWWENRRWIAHLFPGQRDAELDRMFLDHVARLLQGGSRA